MKLLALRAAGFRRFADGVAVEGMVAGVNLLSGPNELGKSTLYQALEAAFLLRHGTTGSVLDAMRPRGGGEPLVEADFESGGRRWRIRKQFGRGRGAYLSDLDSGRIVARASEAEDQLAALTGGARADAPGRIGLVWVRQQRALLTPDPDVEPSTGKAKMRGEANALMDQLTSEVVDAAGSGLAEAMAARAKAELETYVTQGRAGPKRHGPYDLALIAREEARDALERASAAAQGSEQRLARIAKGTAYLASLEDPAARAALTEKIALLEKAVSEAAAQRERDKALVDQLKARELEAKEARRLANAAGEDLVRSEQMRAAMARARDLSDRIASLSAALNANAATPARLTALSTALSLADREETALHDMSTFVDIMPETDAAALIKAGGEAITGPMRIPVLEDLTLAIEGVGVIRVTSSDAARAAKAKARLGDLKAQIAQLYSDLGVSSLAEARERADARERAASDLDAARQAFTCDAPRGLAALEQEWAALEARMAGQDACALAEQASAKEVQLLAARHALEEAKAGNLDEARYQAMANDLAVARRELQRQQDEARRASELLSELKGEQSNADQEGLAGKVESAEAQLQRAEEDVRRCEDEIAALKLLCETLGSVVDNVRGRYLEPVTRAFLPYLSRVFPGADAALREGFSLQALVRSGEQEDLATLSDGTREQLAVLVRLGFAGLFAERGAPVPLVLDDPLVYSDDDRLAAMCDCFNDAGHRHQILVMTCRQSAFASLRAHRLNLSPWRDAGV